MAEMMTSALTSAEVREKLVDALTLDLVGPDCTPSYPADEPLGDPDEILPQSPSRWYLTGFLVPRGAPPEQKADPLGEEDDFELTGERPDPDERAPERSASGKIRFLPSSLGVSVLLPREARTLRVRVRWGDYKQHGETPEGSAPDPETEKWHRTPREELVEFDLPDTASREKRVPDSGGLRVALNILPVGPLYEHSGLPEGVRTVSVFLVNQRDPAPDAARDEAFAFQASLELEADLPFVARPNTRGLLSEDWDENVADLQYRDRCEFAVGHNTATAGSGARVWTCAVPRARVERVTADEIPDVTLKMDGLAVLASGTEAAARLEPLVAHYGEWITRQRGIVAAEAGMAPKRAQTAEMLLAHAEKTAKRIKRGIEMLAQPDCLRAFRLANEAMATAARRRSAWTSGKPGTPRWRPFQLAFLLMNIAGMADPRGALEDRETVDLLFFPTGGGKTEAYLGLAAFTLVLRRLRHPGLTGAGVSVLMRYTLRLLTFDQLGRAATLVCALELLRGREKDLGDWPFEIGLWVGTAATPNQMGSKQHDHQHTARRRVMDFQNDTRKPSPIPLETCPWCNAKFTQRSFTLTANEHVSRDSPDNLRIVCMNRACDFTGDRALPIVAVDEPLYRRLPCFLIATVDKFAAMPWVGRVGGLFGRVQRFDRAGFYGPMDPLRGTVLPPGGLPPPDLIIQDELHLISGPLGTMVGLYETALEELAVRDGVRPKIVASTATVRRAEKQIRALFNRERVSIFPPPGPDRRDSFFARTVAPETGEADTNPRLYLGVAAQGRSPKVIMLRVYLALLAAGQKWYALAGRKSPDNPVDPYMTLVGYFNALRELGGARRLIEDEVRNGLLRYQTRKRIGKDVGSFAKRTIDYEPVELTSRVSTAKVSEAKRRLELAHGEEGRVDVAIATNMISVGLDITRLGLMVIFGQPKTTAEYIQASSRVGRLPGKPGLVVTILNVHKPRDRSHYERFTAYHESFYRSVEATSVTPFSPRALDRGLAASLVALARLSMDPMTPALGASGIAEQRLALDHVVARFAERAFGHSSLSDAERHRLSEEVRLRCEDLLREWSGVVADRLENGVRMQYNLGEDKGAGPGLLRDFLDAEGKNLPPESWQVKFRANRSLRDVEPNVNVWVKLLDRQMTDDAEVQA